MTRESMKIESHSEVTTQEESVTVTKVGESMTINSHNEWDKLREVVLGTADKTMAVLTWTRQDPIPESVLKRAYELAHRAYPQWLLDEVNEDLEGANEVFRQFGVAVSRPKVYDITRMYSSPYGWSSTGNNIYNIRDLHLIVGNNILESTSPLKCRYFEATALYDVWYKYFESGFRWLVAPKPALEGEVLTPYFRDENHRPLTPEDVRYQELTQGRLEKLHKLAEREILFEAANTVRMGRDILYLVSSAGNLLGAKWLQSVLGDEYRVHTTSEIYRSSHIDSTVLCLRPGLVLLNSTRVNEKNSPKIFDRWDKIWFTDVAPVTEQELDFQKNVRDKIHAELTGLGFETNLQVMGSPWVGMNVLSLDPDTVIVDSRQTPLIKVLEKHGITSVPVRMRHPYTHGGGIHCATLDTVRGSKLESYFD
jgi:glycine amidinotransferase/scyllo-inosamine-4-phosphate amidinotransferase 1